MNIHAMSRLDYMFFRGALSPASAQELSSTSPMCQRIARSPPHALSVLLYDAKGGRVEIKKRFLPHFRAHERAGESKTYGLIGV